MCECVCVNVCVNVCVCECVCVNVCVYIYIGRFIMFCVTTNIYNKKTKGPTLMELFTATGKLKKIFF